MRFLIEYKDYKHKEEKNKSLKLLDTFLNEHLIGKFHGDSYECIDILFLNHAPKKATEKAKKLYQIYSHVQLIDTFQSNDSISILDFQAGLKRIGDAIKLTATIAAEPIDYHVDELLEDYFHVIEMAPTTLEELEAYAQKEQETIFNNHVKRIDLLIERYHIAPKPKNKKLLGVRIYDTFENGDLAPFAYIYSEIFGNLLRRANIMTPGYEEIYFKIANTIEEAKQSFALENWHKYTYGKLNLEQFKNANEDEKSTMLFNTLCEGLRFIAEFDHLDKDKIEQVISTIQENGTQLELIYKSNQNDHYITDVIYTVPRTHAAKAEYKLRVTDVRTGHSGLVFIDHIDTFYAPYSFGEILMKKDEIILRGRKSLRAEISRELDKLPEEYRFNLHDILKTEK